jgi:CarD family transcriptional regulator
MPFAVGDKVVYPHHGAAIIEGKEKRVFEEKKTDYFVLRITYGDLKVSIPVDKAEEIGLRDVINDEEVEEVFAVLRKKEARMPTNWSRRFKNHVEKLKSGDIYQVAEVVRNLSLREADKGLSAGEKRMLARARQILVSELTFALNVDEETAELRLDDVLAGTDEPIVKKPARKSAAKKSPAKKAPAKKAPASKAAAEKKAAPAKKSAPAKQAAAEAKPAKAAAKKK